MFFLDLGLIVCDICRPTRMSVPADRASVLRGLEFVGRAGLDLPRVWRIARLVRPHAMFCVGGGGMLQVFVNQILTLTVRRAQKRMA